MKHLLEEHNADAIHPVESLHCPAHTYSIPSRTRTMDAIVSQLTSATGLKNLSLIVPPLLWVNSILPHFYAVALTGGNFTNRAPREYNASISRKQTKTPTDEKFLRAEAASQNGFENLAWASAAIVAANLAKVRELKTECERGSLEIPMLIFV